MTDKERAPFKGKRIHFLDNLRTFMIVLVVVLHAGIVYESSGVGASFWIVDDPAVNDFSGLLNIILDIFIMPTLFFISGYLAPPSLNGKKQWTFVRSKLERLILPWVIGVLTLIPLYKVIFLFSRNLPQERWTTYFHFSNGIISQNWLWFLPVLFLFNVLFLLLSQLKIRIPTISVRAGIAWGLLAGFVYCVIIDALGFQGWTKIGVLDFQNERLLIYFTAFLLGALCFRQKVFDAKSEGRAMYVIASAMAWVPISIYIVFLLFPWFRPNDSIVSATIDRLILWLSYQVSLLCLVYLAIETFRRYQDSQGKLRAELNRNSYHVYIIHVIVMGGLALVLLHAAIPSLAKHLVLAISTFLASNLIISLFRQGAALMRRRVGQAVIIQAEES